MMDLTSEHGWTRARTRRANVPTSGLPRVSVLLLAKYVQSNGRIQQVPKVTFLSRGSVLHTLSPLIAK